MRNPKTFEATPMSRFKVNDKSHTGSGDLKHNDTRTEKMTPWNHSGKVEKSGYEGMGAPRAKASDRTEMKTSSTHFKPTPHSKPGVPAAPKKWHRKNKYDMTSPS